MQIFDANAPTVGTTSPTLQFYAADNQQTTVNLSFGAKFSTAITAAATTTSKGSTGCAAGVDVNFVYDSTR